MTLVSKPCLHRHVTRKNNTLRIGSLDVFFCHAAVHLAPGSVSPNLYLQHLSKPRQQIAGDAGFTQVMHNTQQHLAVIASNPSTSSSGSSSDRRHVDVNWWWDLWNPDLQAWKNICSFFFIDWSNNFQSQHMSFWNRNSGNDGVSMYMYTDLGRGFFKLTNMDMGTSQHLPTSFRIKPPVFSFQSLRRWHLKFQSHPKLLQSEERFAEVNGVNPLPCTLSVLLSPVKVWTGVRTVPTDLWWLLESLLFETNQGMI